MRISNIAYTLPRKLMPFVTSVAMAFPMKTADTTLTRAFSQVQDSFVSLANKELKELKIQKETNFKGGVSFHFDSLSIEKLKQKIRRPENLISYKAPIENTKNVYLEPFGMFFADRPMGKNVRPHLGLDIFVSPYSRKPEKPVIVQAPIDGVVISHKRARKEDNVISNAFTLLGVDGRQYAFDHLARSTDYNDSIPLPTVGTILKAGDKVGYVGATGETTMWHLHLIVMSDKQLAAQKKSHFWTTLAQKTGYCKLRGQVNPLDEKKAGPIAKFLNEYRVKK